MSEHTQTEPVPDRSNLSGGPVQADETDSGNPSDPVQLKHPRWRRVFAFVIPLLLIGQILWATHILLIAWPLAGDEGEGLCFKGYAQSRPNDQRSHMPYEPWLYGLLLVPECQLAAADGVDLDTPAQITAATPQSGAEEDIAQPAPQPEPEPAKPSKTTGSTGFNGNVDAEDHQTVRRGVAIFIAVLAVGMIGGATNSLRAHVYHVAAGSHDIRWAPWNLARPFVGGALAVLFFFILRAGLVQANSSDSLLPEGFIAIGAMVGLFTDHAWRKLSQVAESLFAEPARSLRRNEDEDVPRDAPASPTPAPAGPAPAPPIRDAPTAQPGTTPPPAAPD